MRRFIVFTLSCTLLLAACAPAAPEPTATPLPADTPVPPAETPTPEHSPTRSAPTLPPEPTETLTLTPSVTNTHVTATFIPTRTRLPTSTLTFTPAPTDTPTLTPSLTFTPSLTPTLTATPTISFTPQPRAGVEQRTAFSSLRFGAHFRFMAVGRTIGFLDTSHGTPVSWSWNFGDGSTSDWRSPNHRYTEAGRYVVTLTVRDADGRVSRATRAVVAEREVCVVRSPGQIGLRRTPTSGVVLYLMSIGQEGEATEATLDAQGRLWYRVGTGWAEASAFSVVSGICPKPEGQ